MKNKAGVVFEKGEAVRIHKPGENTIIRRGYIESFSINGDGQPCAILMGDNVKYDIDFITKVFIS